MAWTTPKTWSSEPLTSTDLNTYVRDNQAYLKDRIDGANAAQYNTQVTASTTSATVVDIDATNLNLTITTTGGDVEVTLIGTGYSSGTTRVVFYVDVDGTAYFLSASSAQSSTHGNVNAVLKITGLSAGEHTFKLQFLRESAHTGYTVIECFDVREIMGVVA